MTGMESRSNTFNFMLFTGFEELTCIYCFYNLKNLVYDLKHNLEELEQKKGIR